MRFNLKSKNSGRVWIRLISVPGIVAASALPGYAAVYLTIEQAQQAVFPGGTFTPASLHLTEDQCKQIKKLTGVPVRVKDPKIWKVDGGGYFIVDEVLGKHEFIIYAVGINADGSVKQIEIMDYRETYGYEIRDESWRKQFAGKTGRSPLKLDEDIKNISGATLSSRHITDGVKRVLAMYETVLHS